VTPEDAIALAGGAADAEELAEHLTGAGLAALEETIEFSRGIIQVASGSKQIGNVDLVVTRSTSMDCRVRRLNADQTVILIPVGVLARTRALARMFFSYLQDDRPDITFTGSALDDLTYAWELAPGLRPVFGEQNDQYWPALEEFNRGTATDEELEAFADGITALALHYLALHELGHLYGGHDQVLRLARAGDPRIPPHLTPTKIRRAMEVSADIFAAQNFVPSLLHHPSARPVAEAEPDVFFSTASFTVCMLFGMYDVHQKTAHEYDDGFYPHPIIRYEFWDEATTTGLVSAWPSIVEEAATARTDGWNACMRCFNHLEDDCFTGRFGTPPPETEDGTRVLYVPVTALKYGAASALLPRFQEDNRLWLDFERLAEALTAR
jgi:hypothetical protein